MSNKRLFTKEEKLKIIKEDVKKAREYIIFNHLQPNNCLEKDLHIEVRNDNDSRFPVKLV
jgi:RNase P/RNase MRP subunit POP5